MKLQPREKKIAWFVAAVAGLWALDAVVLTPYLGYRDARANELQTARLQLQEDERLLVEHRRNRRTWSQMLATGLKSDPSATESQVLHAVDEWARATGLNLPSVRRERMEQDKLFGRIVFRATGTGSMSAIARFLWEIQRARLPLRVTELQIATRREGTDDLTLTLGFSTLVSGAVPTTAPQPQQAPAATTTDTKDAT